MLKIYFILFIILILNCYLFNLGSNKKLYVKIIELLIRILIFEIPWFLFYWIFSFIHFIDSYFFSIKVEERFIVDYENKIEHFIAQRIFSYLIKSTLVQLFSDQDIELDFVFLENFYKLNNMKLEKKLYIKYKKYFQETY